MIIPENKMFFQTDEMSTTFRLPVDVTLSTSKLFTVVARRDIFALPLESAEN